MENAATGVLPVFDRKRFENLEEIIDSMRSVPWIREVIVWSNASCDDSRRLRNRLPGVAVFCAGTNLYTLGRYLAARVARTPLIATCDDDCLVEDWHFLREKHLETGRIACYIDPAHFEYGKTRWVHRYSGGIAYEAMVGWGAVFPKSAAYVLADYRQSIDGNLAKQDLLRRKADRFFTILQDCPHELIPQPIHHLPGCLDDTALYRRKDHWRLNIDAAKAAVAYLEQRRCEREASSLTETH